MVNHVGLEPFIGSNRDLTIKFSRVTAGRDPYGWAFITVCWQNAVKEENEA